MVYLFWLVTLAIAIFVCVKVGIRYEKKNGKSKK